MIQTHVLLIASEYHGELPRLGHVNTSLLCRPPFPRSFHYVTKALSRSPKCNPLLPPSGPHFPLSPSLFSVPELTRPEFNRYLKCPLCQPPTLSAPPKCHPKRTCSSRTNFRCLHSLQLPPSTSTQQTLTSPNP